MMAESPEQEVTLVTTEEPEQQAEGGEQTQEGGEGEGESSEGATAAPPEPANPFSDAGRTR